MGVERTFHGLPDGASYRVRVERSKQSVRVVSDEPDFQAEVERCERGAWSVVTPNGSYEARVSQENGEIHVSVGGERFAFGPGARVPGSGAAQKTSARAEVKAPMPGKVVKLLVGAGDEVSAGQGVLLFEAMKMQNEIQSPQGGRVGELSVVEGQAVEARDRLFVIVSS